MYVAILKYPGTWIADADKDWAWAVQRALSDIEGPLIEMALALSMFDESRAPMRSASAEETARELAERQEIADQIRSEFGVSPFDHSDRIELLIAERHMAVKVARGELPQGYRHRLPFMHAKSFILGQDRLERLLANLKKIPRVPAAAIPIIDSFTSSAVREVRHSVAHYEDRTRGLGPGNRPLSLQPIDNGLINARSGALALENLRGNHFGTTLADGSYGEVEISAKTLEAAVNTIQQVIDCFDWEGPCGLIPRS